MKSRRETQDKNYWDRIGSNYSEEIFDAYQEDREGKLKQYLSRHGREDAFAVDIGCGTGKAFPYLARMFGTVLGVDISSELLKVASARPFKNVTLEQMDLSVPQNLPEADFAFCCNVAILPDMKKNIGIIRNVASAIRKGGSALVVVPSLESGLFSGWQLVRWFEKEGTAFEDIPKSDLAFFEDGTGSLLKGYMKINDVPTKHYLETEVQVLFEEAGLRVTSIDKLEYNWDTEFTDPPSWMGSPYPWDWLIECEKK